MKFFFQFLIIKTVDPELDQDRQLENTESALNQCTDPNPVFHTVIFWQR
jgi:hypothetical protein